MKNSELSDVLIFGVLKLVFLEYKTNWRDKKKTFFDFLSHVNKSIATRTGHPKWFTGAESGSLRMRELWSLFLQISLCKQGMFGP